MNTNLTDEAVQDYLAETSLLLSGAEAALLAIELDGAEIDETKVDRVARALHSVKAGAGVFGLINIRMVAHRAESLVGSIRTRQLAPTPGRIHLLLGAIDQLLAWVREPVASREADASGITAGLDASGHANLLKRRWPPAGELRCLLVEDDFASRLLLQTFLARYGNCHIAVNGREAVDAFGQALQTGQPYDLVCMDIMMPEMDGREAVRQVREMEETRGILSNDGARIVMTTAVSDLREVVHCFRELCDGYLVKPVDLTQLLGFMRQYELVR